MLIFCKVPQLSLEIFLEIDIHITLGQLSSIILSNIPSDYTISHIWYKGNCLHEVSFPLGLYGIEKESSISFSVINDKSILPDHYPSINPQISIKNIKDLITSTYNKLKSIEISSLLYNNHYSFSISLPSRSIWASGFININNDIIDYIENIAQGHCQIFHHLPSMLFLTFSTDYYALMTLIEMQNQVCE